MVFIYSRNKCQIEGCNFTFKKKNGENYSEGHHVEFLAKGGSQDESTTRGWVVDLENGKHEKVVLNVNSNLRVSNKNNNCNKS